MNQTQVQCSFSTWCAKTENESSLLSKHVLTAIRVMRMFEYLKHTFRQIKMEP
jgi:hypothetical protein